MLQAEHITFAYPGREAVLRDVSLAVEAGERVAILAPSGFGKTTLCQIIAGYLKPASGRVLVDDKPLPKRGVCPVQMIWQHPEKVLDPRMRMADSLLQAGEPEPQVLEGLGIQEKWKTRYPHELSGGEMQRFCIARALTANPSYIVADEISTMLDAVTQAQLWRFLIEQTESRGIGTLLTSHSPALIDHVATRVVELGR